VSKRAFGLLLFAILALAGAQASAAAAPTVILLSLDGVRADYPDRGGLPAFTRLARDGVRAERLAPVFPPITFPSHVSLATGAPVDRHGIVGNVFVDRERGRFHYVNDSTWQQAEPIWVAAERQGVPTALFFWVGSEGPWHGTSAHYVMQPFDDGVPDSKKVDRILTWLDLPARERPRLILSWWHGADAPGHRHGPDSAAVNGALAEQDAQLVRLLEGLDARKRWADTTLLLVSDHGMAAVSEGIDLQGVLGEKGIVAQVTPSGGIAVIALQDPGQREAAMAALSELPGVKAYPSDALPEAWRYGPATRLGDLVAITSPPRVFREGTLERVAASVGLMQGAHGYDPSLPEMGGIFFAMGRGVKAGTKLGEVSTLDVAPTVARLLGIEPPKDAEGRPLESLVPPEAESVESPQATSASPSETETQP
jgi:predicted AlkP superfamily pyrophosphatase or phosphodiesterase